MKKTIILISVGIIAFGVKSCKYDNEADLNPEIPVDQTPLALDYPSHFPEPIIPLDNPTTVEGVELGRHLFYETRLSGDNTLSCAGCHFQQDGFSDPLQFSVGIDGVAGSRNAMALINLAWDNQFFWDGRANSLERQAGMPVEDPIEMHETWPDALMKLRNDDDYVEMFKAAFGTSGITRQRAQKAIAQFERTMISGNSRYDRNLRGEEVWSIEEQRGFNIFVSEVGDCFHCHTPAGHLFTDFAYKNNGLDSVFTDLGRYNVTGNPDDMAKFKVPTLRNIEFTAPYMHDGRFQTLEEVIEFYNMGGHPSATIDPNMKAAGVGRNWNPQQKADLLAFLKALSDTDFINNPEFSAP